MNQVAEISGQGVIAMPTETLYNAKLKFSISYDLLEALITYGASSKNKEVCGLVTGEYMFTGKITDTYWVAEKFHPIKNVSTNKLGYDDYVMDPTTSFNILKDTSLFGGNKNDLVAIFHTHPHSTPYPSAIDIHHAAYNVVYIIYSVTYNKFSFQLWKDNWFIPITLEVQ